MTSLQRTHIVNNSLGDGGTQTVDVRVDHTDKEATAANKKTLHHNSRNGTQLDRFFENKNTNEKVFS